MKRRDKRPKGEPETLFLRRRLDQERERRERLVAAIREDIFGTLTELGVLATDIRRQYVAWEERVRQRSAEDRHMRENIRKEEIAR